LDGHLEGNILAQQSVVLNTGAAITCGRAVALIGAVTLDSNAISDNCTNGTDFGSDGFSGGVAATSPTDVPEPDALFLFSVGLTGLLTLRLSRSGRSEIRRPIE
jgi:type VI secretion system secreted protein VgrG